jgi:hypothetical protein
MIKFRHEQNHNDQRKENVDFIKSFKNVIWFF